MAKERKLPSTVFKHGSKRPENAGRQKGGKNKKTLILDSFAKDIVEGGMEKFREELKKLKGKAYIDAYMTLFEYVKPKLSRSEHTIDGNVNHHLKPNLKNLTDDELRILIDLQLKSGTGQPQLT